MEGTGQFLTDFKQVQGKFEYLPIPPSKIMGKCKRGYHCRLDEPLGGRRTDKGIRSMLLSAAPK